MHLKQIGWGLGALTNEALQMCPQMPELNVFPQQYLVPTFSKAEPLVQGPIATLLWRRQEGWIPSLPSWGPPSPSWSSLQAGIFGYLQCCSFQLLFLPQRGKQLSWLAFILLLTIHGAPCCGLKPPPRWKVTWIWLLPSSALEAAQACSTPGSRRSDHWAAHAGRLPGERQGSATGMHWVLGGDSSQRESWNLTDIYPIPRQPGRMVPCREGKVGRGCEDWEGSQEP